MFKIVAVKTFPSIRPWCNLLGHRGPLQEGHTAATGWRPDVERFRVTGLDETVLAADVRHDEAAICEIGFNPF